MGRGRDNELGTFVGALFASLGVLVFGLCLCWIAVFFYDSVGGDVLAPVQDGRWVGAPILVLIALFAIVGLAAIAGSVTLLWMLMAAVWEGRRQGS